MDYYKNEIKAVLEDKIAEGYETKEEILNRWLEGNTDDDFGNMTGSRFCNRWKAEEALKEAGFPFDDELNDLLEEVGYDFSILNKGAETIDVIFCELIAPMVASELLENKS